MSKVILYSARACPFAHRTRLVLSEKKVQFELKEIDLALSTEGPFFLGAVPSLVDFALYPWFERWPALAHYRGIAIPSTLTRLSRWRAAVAGLESVRTHENTADYYIERYARHAAAKSQVA